MAGATLPGKLLDWKSIESEWVAWWSTCPTHYGDLYQRDGWNNEFDSVEGAVQLSEKDPSGKQQGEPGAKLDAGKSPVARGALHYFPRAISAVAELSGIGARKYSWKGWESVPNGVIRYSDALVRHELKIEDDFSRVDPNTGVLEATAVAWNALARLELILRESSTSSSS